MQPNEVHKMHFVSDVKYILCTSFCVYGGFGQYEVHFMYYINEISFKMTVFREMRSMKCTSFPLFAPMRPNEVHKMHFVSDVKYILCTSFCVYGGFGQYEVHVVCLISRTKWATALQHAFCAHPFAVLEKSGG